MVDINSFSFGDSKLASKFNSIFRDYFDLGGRIYGDDDTNNENGNEKGESTKK